MVDLCPYCSLTTGGQHEADCPLRVHDFWKIKYLGLPPDLVETSALRKSPKLIHWLLGEPASVEGTNG